MGTQSSNNPNSTNLFFITPWHIGVRLLESTVFGMFNSEIKNKWQVRIILFIHILLLIHLLVMRPYSKFALMLSEILTTMCECGMLTTLLIISEIGNESSLSSDFLLYMAYILMFVIIGYEIFVIMKILGRLLRKKLRELLLRKCRIKKIDNKQGA